MTYLFAHDARSDCGPNVSARTRCREDKESRREGDGQRRLIAVRTRSGIAIERTENAYRLALDDCYGTAGDLEAKGISIRLIPSKPKGARS